MSEVGCYIGHLMLLFGSVRKIKQVSIEYSWHCDFFCVHTLIYFSSETHCAHVTLQHMHLVRSDHRQHEITSACNWLWETQPWVNQCKKWYSLSYFGLNGRSFIRNSLACRRMPSYMCCSVTQGVSVCTSSVCFLMPYFPPAFFPHVISSKFLAPEIGLFSFQVQWNRQGLCLDQVHSPVLAALPTTSLVPLIFQRCSAL